MINIFEYVHNDDLIEIGRYDSVRIVYINEAGKAQRELEQLHERIIRSKEWAASQQNQTHKD
jgi:hypothetical protein